MLIRAKALYLAALLLGLSCIGASAQAILKPPFGLRWGDSPEKLVAWSQEHDLNLTIRLPGKQPGLSLLRIDSGDENLPDSKASALEARFLNGQLFEIALDYADSDATANEMEARFEAIKKQTSAEYGALRTNQQQRAVADQFVTRTRSFHHEPVKGLFLLLAYTEVEDLLRKSKSSRFSLIYRNDNFRKELEKTLGQP